ncbi:MAG: hypothetical protein HYZ11_09585 [Candidatus Tectomicrobia bacterium]|uniref:DUF3757 domain-containing protein n=1 Tax=Tectimicrobiota bacterium TaxID=2528274 RepID=A0A932MNJ9_UNCTE|nr:hypothetical protein [Candidatus Tectomicrobia bacterium]
MAVFRMLAVVVAIWTLSADAALAAPQEVHPLTRSECAAVREMLEEAVPIGPGWRMSESAFPPGVPWVSGRFCRLLAVGTGEHVESEKIRSAEDIAGYIAGALRRADWSEEHFARKFRAEENGQRAFALEKGRAVCRVTLVSKPVSAVSARPVREARKNGAGSLSPYERSYWIGVDCFKR